MIKTTIGVTNHIPEFLRPNFIEVVNYTEGGFISVVNYGFINPVSAIEKTTVAVFKIKWKAKQ